MEIINCDTYQEQPIKHHFLIPDCHYMLVGSTGQGKTNVLVNLLLKYFNADQIVIYTLNPQQEKYQLLKDFFDCVHQFDPSKPKKSTKTLLEEMKQLSCGNPELCNLLKDCFVRLLESDRLGITFELGEDVAPVENLDDIEQKVIVFDDLKLDNMNPVKEYFSLSRNKSCNCLYLCQSYYDVPKYIRRNTKCFVLFNGLDNKDVRCIAHDHSAGITSDEFVRVYHAATESPFSFMVLDKTARLPPEMYRKGFDCFYQKT